MKKHYTIKKTALFLSACLLTIGLTFQNVQAQSFSEDFYDITLLSGNDWSMQNLSSTLGLTDWFQGNPTVFPSHAGGDTSYIGANFNSVTGAGEISNWLIAPATTFNNGDVISFYTRCYTGSTYPDRLQFRLSLNGASTNVGSTSSDVGDFTTVLAEVNPNLTVGGYPETWTQYTATISGLSSPTLGRVAFRYWVTNGGPSGSNSDYIGIDSFDYTANSGVGIENTEISNSLNIYPNPAKDVVSVSFSSEASAVVNIISNDGKLVYSSNDGMSGNVNHKIDVTSFAAGVYILQIQSEGSLINRKLIVK